MIGSGPDTLIVPQADPGASYYALKALIDKAVIGRLARASIF